MLAMMTSRASPIAISGQPAGGLVFMPFIPSSLPLSQEHASNQPVLQPVLCIYSGTDPVRVFSNQTCPSQRRSSPSLRSVRTSCLYSNSHSRLDEHTH